MTPRDRIIKTLNHDQPDRVAMDLWSKGGGMTNSAYLRLKEYLGLVEDLPQYRPGQTSAYYDERILEVLGTDVRHVFLGQPKDFNYKRLAQNKIVNEWGITIQIEKDSSAPIEPPLAGASLEELDDYPWPYPHRPGRIDGLKERIEFLWSQTEYAIAFRPVTPIDWGPFEMSWALRGMENLFLDMLDNKDFAHRLLQKVVETQIQFYDLALDIVGPYIQIVQIGDDYGMQTAPMMSLQLFREMIKPYDAELIQAIKKKAPQAKIYFHSCGSVRAFIEDFIEIGVDILNPMQPTAAGMNSSGLKRDFGKKLSFQGGISVQGALQGTLVDVETEVKQRINSFGREGGYILAPGNNIPGDVPPENVVHMYHIAQSYTPDW